MNKETKREAETVIIQKLLRDESGGRACGCRQCLSKAEWSHKILEGMLGFEEEDLISKIVSAWQPEIFGRPLDKIKPYEEQISCGPAALKIAYDCFGLEFNEDEIVDTMTLTESALLLKEGYEQGWWPFVRDHPKRYKFEVAFKENTEYQDLLSCLQVGLPIIISWFSNADPEENSHFAVVCAANNFNITLADPLIGKFLTVSKENFLERWSDNEGYSYPAMVIHPILPQGIITAPKA